MNQSILDAIHQLEKDISDKQIALKELMKMVQGDLRDTKALDLNSPVEFRRESSLNELFPIKGRKDQKIMYLFNNVITNGIVMSEIQLLFNEYNGKPENVANVVRRLKNEGRLSAIKYNNQNKSTFWGLSNWINDVEENFKKEFKPNEGKLPIEIKQTEIIGKD